jgi:chromosome segregation ATPase
LDRLRERVTDLSEQLSEERHAHMAVVDAVRADAEAKDAVIRDQRQEIARLNASREDVRVAYEQAWVGRVEELESKLADAGAVADSLRDEVAKASSFLDERAGLEDQIAALRQRLVESEAALIKQRDDAKTLLMATKSDLRRAHEAELIAAREAATREAEESLDATSLQLRLRNAELASDLEVTANEAAGARAVSEKLFKHGQGLSTELAMRTKSLRETARRVVETDKQREQEAERAAALQTALAQLAAQQQDAVAAATGKVQAEMDALRAEHRSMYRLLEAKTLELQRVRGLAVRVLQQRTDLESVLIQLVEDTVNASAGARDKRHPLISVTGPTAQIPAVRVAPSATIARLTDEEKTKILRDIILTINQ